MRLLLLLPLVLLMACGSSDEQVLTPADGDLAAGGGGISRAENDLLVEITPGEGIPVLSYTLTCVGFVDGDHPRGDEACAHLKGLDQPFAPLPDDVMCTQVYGGPQTARITGLWRSEPVDLELSRSDGCRTAQWDSLGPLLDVPGASAAQ